MRKLTWVAITAAVLLASAASAQPFMAGECYVGPGLASTLLFPYFEVDLADPNGVGTLLAINNGLSDETLTRVVFWTDWGIPTVAFDLYLPAFGVETINVSDVLNGTIPSTGSGVDLSAFEFCGALPPFHSNPVLPANEQAQLQADHTGVVGPVFPNDCAGSAQGDQIARGYVTVDVVDECSGLEGVRAFFTPADVSTPYFVDGGSSEGIAIVDNRLWGDVIYVDFNQNSAQGSEAIPIWANLTSFVDNPTFTFYGRFSGWDGRDERVPLPTLWDQRFLNGGPFEGGADLIVWRDPSDVISPVECGTQPVEFPLMDESTASEHDGTPLALAGTTNFPLTTQRVPIDDLDIPFAFGWLQVDALISQAWIQPSLNAAGLFSANLNGTPVGFLCNEQPPVAVLTEGEGPASPQVAAPPSKVEVARPRP